MPSELPMKSGRDEAARGSIPGSSPRPDREHRKPQPTTCYTVVCVKTAVAISEVSLKKPYCKSTSSPHDGALVIDVARHLILSTASLSIVGYEHSLDDSASLLRNDDHHVNPWRESFSTCTSRAEGTARGEIVSNSPGQTSPADKKENGFLKTSVPRSPRSCGGDSRPGSTFR